MNKILIVDDEINIGQLLSRFLSRNGFEVTIAITGAAALEYLSQNTYNLVLCDFRLEDTDGRELLRKIKSAYPNTGVIIITGYSDVKLAVELIKMGAYDYITKPLYPDEILNTIHKAIQAHQPVHHQHQQTSAKEQKTEDENEVLPDEFIVGQSLASKEILRQIKLVAPTNYSVIISGESGTGKESAAKSIHLNSPRKNKPFIAMDCGSLSNELGGSEFFGHEKGAFTGAAFTKIGHFELANGGTLFLDEIGNLSYDLQASLLRIVQERKLKRIGGTKEIDLDLRIIVATNESLVDAIKEGRFREDLYHRFNEFKIVLPPLRHRGQDIITFAEHFLKETNTELNRNITGFSPEAVECFMNYNWPGNIRELKNVIKRSTLLTEGGQIQVKALPLELSMFAKTPYLSETKEPVTVVKKNAGANLKVVAKEAEYETILRVLNQVKFNKTKAAKILNIDRKTLYNKIKAFNLE